MPSDLTLLLSALAIDAVFGEAPSRLHPVVWMGKAIERAERPFRDRPPSVQLVAGALIALALPTACAAAAAILLSLADDSRVIGFVVALWLLKATFAVRALGKAAAEVRVPLEQGDLGAARRALGALCGRDASSLDERGLASGAVSSVAENLSDSFVAPLLYFVLFGLPGAIFYRAVNTLDAMIGHRGPFEHLGKVSARLDDVLNYVPARLAAVLILAAGLVTGRDVRAGATIWRRDARRTQSPNGGHPMAAMAGLLRVELEKPGHYRLGDAIEPLGPRTIAAAWRLALVAAAIAGALAALALLGAGASGG